MTTTIALQGVAEDFLGAYRTGTPIPPPRDTITNLDLDGAYRIQQLQEEAFTAQGRTVVGRKIGLTSLAMQKQLGVDSPDFGFFTDDLVYHDGARIQIDQFISPKVEPELAFILDHDLPADATFDQVTHAIRSTHLAIEIIDSRVTDWNIRLVDTVADNASCGAIIINPEPIQVSPQEMPTLRAEMRIDGELVGKGTGADVMGHPLAPLHWLAHTLGTQGVPLKAGDIILTGSFCGAAPITAGHTVTIDYPTHGTLTASFH